MAHFGFLLPDDLSRKFDAFAKSRGGRSAALRMLVGQALEAEGATFGPTPLQQCEKGAFQSVTIRLSAEDVERLDEECRSFGLSRGQWLQSCVRHRLRGSRHFSSVDRIRLAKIVSEMRHMKTILFRCAGRLERMPNDGTGVDKYYAVIEQLSRDVARAITAIEAAFQGNDRYWRQPSSPRKPADDPSSVEHTALRAGTSGTPKVSVSPLPSA